MRSLLRRGFPLVLTLVVLSFSATGCSSGSDATADVATPDTTVDAGQDTVTPDLQPTDTVVPDQVEQDLVEDTAIPWDSLPTLPAGPFTTYYVAGAASRDVTPQQSIYMGGFGLCAGNPVNCRVSEGVHDPIQVNAVAIGDTASGEVVIFLSVDTTGMLRYDIDLVRNAAPAAFQEAFGVKMDPSRLLIAASHSHSAPDDAGLWAPMEGTVREADEYITFVRNELLQAALDAYGNMGDIQMTWGLGSAPNNSDDVLADDEDIYAVKGVRPDGTVVFTMTRWAGHPTCWGSENNGLSADYVGSFRKKIVEDIGGVSVFLNGPIGSVYVAEIEGCTETDPFPEGWQDPDNDAGRKQKFACIGFNLADQVVKALASGAPVAETGVKVRYQQFQFHPTNYILMMALEMGPVPFEIVDVKDPDSMMHSQFSWVTLGDLNYITTPGESFPAFGQGVKDRLGELGVANIVVLGLTQDWLGYLMTPEQYFASEPDLSYNKSLSPGENVYDGYMAGLNELLSGEFGE